MLASNLRSNLSSQLYRAIALLLRWKQRRADRQRVAASGNFPAAQIPKISPQLVEDVGGEGLVVHQSFPNKAVINSWIWAMVRDLP